MAFKVDRVDDLDRAAIRRSVIDRFSVEKMTDGYEKIYRSMLGSPEGGRIATDGAQGNGAHETTEEPESVVAR
jgi:hypothetical protein